MSSKKSLAALAFATALTAQAQAQTKPDQQCADTQTKVVSALALANGGNGVIGCKDAPSPSATSVSTPPVSTSSPSSSSGTQFSLTPFHAGTQGTGIALGAVLGGRDVAIGLKADGTKDMKHATPGGATRIGDTTLSLTGAVAQEDAGTALGNKNYSGKNLTGGQVMAGLDTANIGPMKTLGVTAGAGKTASTGLGSTTTTTTETRNVDTPTATEHWMDTYATTKTTQYKGTEWSRLGVRGVMDVGTQGELSFRAGAYRNPLIGNTATGGVGYTHYMGKDGKIDLRADLLTGNSQIYSVKYSKPLSEGWTLTMGVEHLRSVIDNTRAMVGLTWTPGAKSRYDRPTGPDSIDAHRVIGTNLASAENSLQGLGAYGKVEETTGPKTLTGSVKTGETLKTPSAPTLSASVSGSTVTLSCPAIAGATSYEFYQGATLLGTVASCSYTVSGLADGSYTFTVKAKNSAGTSGASNAQSVNVSTDPMPTGPILANIVTDDSTQTMTVNAGGVTDALSRTIVYTATGLPSGVTINSNTGVISGPLDAFGTEVFTITVTATPVGGARPLIRTFTYTVADVT